MPMVMGLRMVPQLIDFIWGKYQIASTSAKAQEVGDESRQHLVFAEE